MSTAFTTPTACSVLIVDDDEHTRLSLSLVLAQAGYPVAEAIDGADGLAQFARVQPHLVLLDLNLPGLGGWEVLAALRQGGHRGGIILITGYSDTPSIVRGLTSGADDYIAKPLDPAIVCARVEAVARRVAPSSAPRVLQLGHTTVDLVTRAITRPGFEAKLTRIEHRLLTLLAAEPGRCLTREELLTQVWGYADTTCTRTVDTHIWRLRIKLGESPHAPRWLVTVSGSYRLVLAPEVADNLLRKTAVA